MVHTCTVMLPRAYRYGARAPQDFEVADVQRVLELIQRLPSFRFRALGLAGCSEFFKQLSAAIRLSPEEVVGLAEVAGQVIELPGEICARRGIGGDAVFRTGEGFDILPSAITEG